MGDVGPTGGSRLTEISPTNPYSKHRHRVLDLELATIDVGAGDPIVFLHGNPTSSFLWRNVIPHVEHLGRCVAPDLVGFGDSDKLPGSGDRSYAFVETRRYLDAMLDQLGIDDRVVLVLHDWGSGLGFDWAHRNEDRVAGIAHLESIVAPRAWAQLTPEGRRFFERIRSPEGERMALDENVFLEHGLPGGVIRTLTPEELAEYRRPFLDAGEARRPTLTWPREIPFDGDPADVHEIVAAYSAWLRTTPIPKLLIDVSEGDTLTGPLLELARTFPNQTETSVRGRHFAPEDSPHEIGAALADWIPNVPR